MPGEVIAIDGDEAVVSVDGRLRRASTLPVGTVAIGDRVIVAAGSVMARLDETDAEEMERLVRVAYGKQPGGRGS